MFAYMRIAQQPVLLAGHGTVEQTDDGEVVIRPAPIVASIMNVPTEKKDAIHAFINYWQNDWNGKTHPQTTADNHPLLCKAVWYNA